MLFLLLVLYIKHSDIFFLYFYNRSERDWYEIGISLRTRWRTEQEVGRGRGQLRKRTNQSKLAAPVLPALPPLTSTTRSPSQRMRRYCKFVIKREELISAYYRISGNVRDDLVFTFFVIFFKSQIIDYAKIIFYIIFYNNYLNRIKWLTQIRNATHFSHFRIFYDTRKNPGYMVSA